MNFNRFAILLSASVPSEKRSERYRKNYSKIKNAQLQIEEAVIGLARNTFQAGGKLIFGGHPSISPLVAMVATEFSLEKGIEDSSRMEEGQKPITIYQSRAYEGVIPKETAGLFNLGYSNIVWTNAINGEQYDPKKKDVPQCKASLREMRSEMIDRTLDAMVCVGGMEGVEEEFEIFQQLHPQKPVFLLARTGGATEILAEQFSTNKLVRVIDTIEYRTSIKEKYSDEDSAEKFEIIPYSYITALLVKEILEKRR